MVDLLAVAAVGLLVLGVVGSVAPLLPGALFSLSGVFLYWWSTGYAEPSLLVLVGLVAVGVIAAVVDYAAGAVAASAGGASTLTAAAAAVVGVAFLVLIGPLGMLFGVVGTVFALELRRHGDPRRGAKTALYATVGMLGSAVVQVMLTGSMLVVFLLVVFG